MDEIIFQSCNKICCVEVLSSWKHLEHVLQSVVRVSSSKKCGKHPHLQPNGLVSSLPCKILFNCWSLTFSGIIYGLILYIVNPQRRRQQNVQHTL